MSTPNPRPNPYVGPRAFQTGEKLYGRDRELSQLTDLLIAERIVLLHSPSGAGKSSLIQAGLIPKMEEEGFQVLPLIRINLEPPHGLREDLYFNRYIYSALVSLQESLPNGQRASVEALANMNLEDCLEQCSFSLNGGGENGSSSKLLIFDQFEEILTVNLTQRQEKAAFFNQLGSVLRHRNYWVLFSMREDYLAALDPYLRPVPTRLRNTFRLDFLGKEAACQAIQWPARQENVDFTDDAVTKLVDDLRRVQVQRPDGVMEEQFGQYVEPVQLQVVCYRLWEHLPKDARQVLTSDIESVGDVDAALSDYYAEQVAAVAARTGTSERSIRDWFEHRLITPGGIRGQVLMGKDQSDGLDNRAIGMLENAHLLRAEKRAGAIWFELAHDRLIGPVRKNNDAWFQDHLSLFQRQATLWETGKRPDSLLLRERDLEEAERWAEAHPKELTDTERIFLENCRQLRKREEEVRKLAEAQQVAESERQRAELQARSAQQLRRLARIITAALVLAVITTILAGFFWQRSQLQADFNASLAATNATIAAVNQVYASTNQAIAITAQSASTQALAQQKTAEAASVKENIQRKTAEAASLLANDQKATAQYNSEQAHKNADEANKQAGIAFSRQLASQALSYLSTRQDLSMLLGVESFNTADTLEAKSALLIGLQRGLGQTVHPVSPPIPAENVAVVSAAISPVEDQLAYGNAEGKVVIWDYIKGEIVDVSNDHQGIVWGLAFSPDGKILASAGEDAKIVLWDLSTHKKTVIPNMNKILSVSWSPQGGKLAAAVGPHVVIWDTANLKAPAIDQNILYDVNSVAWSPDGAMVAAGTSTPDVTILDSTTGLINQRLTGHQGKVRTVAWSTDSKTLVSGGEDHLVIVWDAVKWTQVGEPLKGHFDQVLSVSISHDNNILASGSKDGVIILWDMKTRQKFGLPLTTHTSDVNALTFAPKDGPTLLLSASRDKSAQLVELITQQPLRKQLTRLDGQVSGLAVDPSGSLQAVELKNNRPVLWNVQSSQQGSSISVQDISSAALSKDGQILAIGTGAGKIDLFEASSGKPIGSFDTSGGEVLSLAVSPDGKTIASSRCVDSAQVGDQFICKQNEIHLWDATTGASSGGPILGHEDFILALAFSPDGKLLASGSQDKTILLWDVSSGKQVGLPLARHISGISSLAFSPDGKILASGSSDNSLILWDVLTNQPIGEPLIGSPGRATGLAFSPDNKILYSGYPDGTILTWDVDFGAWVQRACGLAGRNMTAEEWQQFFRFQNQSYHKTCDQFDLENQPAAAGTASPSPTAPAPATVSAPTATPASNQAAAPTQTPTPTLTPTPAPAGASSPTQTAMPTTTPTPAPAVVTSPTRTLAPAFTPTPTPTSTPGRKLNKTPKPTP